LQSEISCRNPVKYNVKYIAGLCSAYLFVAGSIILLQCFSMIHKTSSNLRNDEIWRLHLLEQIPTFGELDDKNTGPNHWKRNNFSWNLLQKRAVWYKALGYHTHLLQYCFCLILEQSNPYKKALLSMNFGKCPLNFMFLVSPNDERFYSYLGSSVGPSPMKILITSYYQNISFRNTVLSQKFEARFYLLIIFCKILQSEISCGNPVKYNV